jgi:hypothetical protein
MRTVWIEQVSEHVREEVFIRRYRARNVEASRQVSIAVSLRGAKNFKLALQILKEMVYLPLSFYYLLSPRR